MLMDRDVRKNGNINTGRNKILKLAELAEEESGPEYIPEEPTKPLPSQPSISKIRSVTKIPKDTNSILSEEARRFFAETLKKEKDRTLVALERISEKHVRVVNGYVTSAEIRLILSETRLKREEQRAKAEQRNRKIAPLAARGGGTATKQSRDLLEAKKRHNAKNKERKQRMRELKKCRGKVGNTGPNSSLSEKSCV